MSKDVFTAPSTERDPRFMWLWPVYEHQKLGHDDLWATIRSKVLLFRQVHLLADICSKVVELLDQRNIRLSSVDLVRFSWVEDIKENEDGEENEDDEDVHYLTKKNVPLLFVQSLAYNARSA